jgi:hypothetical protein
MLIAKILVSSAIALGAWGAVPASADPNQSGTDPNPFGGLTSSSQETSRAGTPVSEELDRGILAGLSR